MGVMPFDAQPIPQVEEFVSKHYKGGTVIDFGCGCGRYAHLFPDDMYMGLDGCEENIKTAKRLHPKHQFAVADIDTKSKGRKFDYLFSSVVFDQLENLPMDWADTYILVENKKYAEIYEPQINEPLEGSEGIRLMVCK